ncbi:hypothetical protein GCM10027405_37560 [Arthrobacter alkaliphilus]
MARDRRLPIVWASSAAQPRAGKDGECINEAAVYVFCVQSALGLVNKPALLPS